MLKTKGFIAVTSLIVITSALGGVAGWFLGGMYKVIGPVTNNVYEDKEVIFSTNLDAPKKLLQAAGVSSMDELDKVDVSSLVGKNGLTVGDIAESAQLYMHSKSNIVVKSNNLAKSNVIGVENNQVTNSTWIKKDKLYFKENVSYSSYASFGERTYNLKADAITPLSKPLDNQLNYYRINTNKQATNADFASSKFENYYVNVPEGEVDENGLDVKSYSTTFGISIYKPFNYDFSEANIKKDDAGKYVDETIKNSKLGEESVYKTSITSIENGYEIYLTIDKKAMENYASYIYTTTRDASQMAKMKEKPEFISTGVKIVTNNKLEISSVHTDEFYNVISSIAIAESVPTVCSSDLIITYEADEKIPTFKEKISYEG